MKKEKQNDDNFIMLPTVDFCFKELMRIRRCGRIYCSRTWKES